MGKFPLSQYIEAGRKKIIKEEGGDLFFARLSHENNEFPTFFEIYGDDIQEIVGHLVKYLKENGLPLEYINGISLIDPSLPGFSPLGKEYKSKLNTVLKQGFQKT
jgi:hypothetical protein